MKNTFLLLFSLSLTCLFAQSIRYEPEAQSVLVRHKYYSLDFDTLHRQARWVYYMLTSGHIKGEAKRADNFQPDSSAPNCAELSDYKGSGYDRGPYVLRTI